MVTYNIVIYVNANLIIELERNLPKAIKSSSIPYEEILAEILFLTTFFQTTDSFNQSPDPKDNFLFDLAMQTGSEVIVSDEKVLLSFKESPIPVRSLGWFKETFPIEL